MTARLSRQRWWIACLYCLAVVLAQGVHTHDGPSWLGDHAAEALSCGAEHTGSGSEADETRGAALAFESCLSDCPSCDFALNHQAALADRVDAPEIVRRAPLTTPTPANPDTSSVRPRSRAPPIALSA